MARKRARHLTLMIPVFIVAVAAAFLLGGLLFPQAATVSTAPPLKLLQTQETFDAQITVPAVDENSEGVLTTIGITVAPGTGKTLIDIENILSFADTQNSIRIARDVAEEVTGIDLSDRDITVTIRANASVIEGPSAGGAVTAAMIAAIQGKALNPQVMMTGTINPDGSIGPVGQVVEKAAAAKKNGATLFLVPRQGGFPVRSVDYERVVECRDLEGIEFCTTTYVKTAPSKRSGIEVKEIATIRDALQYLLAEGG